MHRPTMSTSLVDHPIFISCSRRQRRQINSLGTRVNVRERSVLAREGRIAQEFGLIVSGVATVSAEGIPLGTIGPGQHYGAVSLIERGDRFCLSAATVIAASDMVIEALSIPEFDTLLCLAPRRGPNYWPRSADAGSFSNRPASSGWHESWRRNTSSSSNAVGHAVP